MMRKLVAALVAIVASAVVASAQVIFDMDYTRDSGGWPGMVGNRVTHTQVRVPGGGPSGQDAFDMIQQYAPTANRYGAEFDWGWNGDLEAVDPPIGSRRYYRWRMRFSPDTNLRGVYSGDGSAVDLTNKILIIGDGCGRDCRVILSYRGGSADGRPRYWRIALDGGVDPGDIRDINAIPANGEWFTVQLEVTTGANGGYKLWLNNQDQSAPNASVTRLVNPTRHRYVFFGAYNNDGLQSTGVHAYRHADFEIGTTFAASWGGTTTQPPPTPVAGEFFREDFSAGLTRTFQSSAYGRLSDQAQFAAVDGAVAHTIPAGAMQAYATQHFADARTGPVAAAGDALVDVYVQYRIRYAPGFDFAAEAKQVILGTQDGRRHENACCNPWVAHYLTIMVGPDGQLMAEGNNKQSASGQWINLGPFAPARLETGRWYTVETRRRLNDFGQDNGIFSLWLDGVQVAHRVNIRWRTAWDGTFGADASGTNFLMISDYFNGGARPATSQIQYDDAVMSTAPIGVVVVPPPPPVALTVTATGSTRTCMLVTRANQAPTTAAWGVQFARRLAGDDAWTPHGTRDTTAPYVRSATVPLGTWEVRAVWTRTGVAPVDVPALAVWSCEP